ncbi:hypothetical protein AVEN_236236-1 [Araneus ventricosus]|uniref:Tc1-like transposase DDE domain-containing protein n=1 Tax=Araneus ventricosus TaxID=182803 RepID=A0A4Y2CAI0_ARAVE|nr:hypothetical protein AVEN_236236-1 [Araneus ventricosus]
MVRINGNQNKKRGKNCAGIVLLHDNAGPRAALLTQQLPEWFRWSWEVFDYPAYSPDLALSDYHLFQHMKRFPIGQHFPRRLIEEEYTYVYSSSMRRLSHAFSALRRRISSRWCKEIVLTV